MPTPHELLASEVAGLIVGLDDIKAKVAALDGLPLAVDALMGNVANLAADLESLLKADSDVPSMIIWARLDQEAAAAAWKQLNGWVTEILVARYPHLTLGQAGAKLRLLCPCWYEHPYVVEELTALYVAWCGAYQDPTAAPTAASIWHESLVKTCGRVAQQLHCAKEHKPDAAGDGTDPDGFEAFVAADVMSRPVKTADGE